MDLTPLLALVPAQYAVYVSAGVGAAAVAAMFLKAPTATSSKAYTAAYTVVNVLAANKLHAANATAPKA